VLIVAIKRKEKETRTKNKNQRHRIETGELKSKEQEAMMRNILVLHVIQLKLQLN